MSYSWDITEDAALDLEETEDYIFSYSGDADYAEAVVDEIESEFDVICEHPFLRAAYEFPEGFEPAHGYRSTNVRRYKIFYYVDEARETVHIYRIRHVVSDFTRASL